MGPVKRCKEPPHPRLDELHPEWVEGARDWGEGCSFDCLAHGPACRLLVLFSNPAGGHKPDKATMPRLPRYYRVGSSFSTLTLMGPVDLGEHFRGHLIEGRFWPELVLH